MPDRDALKRDYNQHIAPIYNIYILFRYMYILNVPYNEQKFYYLPSCCDTAHFYTSKYHSAAFFHV